MNFQFHKKVFVKALAVYSAIFGIVAIPKAMGYQMIPPIFEPHLPTGDEMLERYRSEDLTAQFWEEILEIIDPNAQFLQDLMEAEQKIAAKNAAKSLSED